MNQATATAAELQLAMRAPGAGWLGVLACVIDEASQDPNFDDRQRQLAAQLLQQGQVAPMVADAARRCAASFEAQLDNDMDFSALVPPAPARPKLTLVGTDC